MATSKTTPKTAKENSGASTDAKTTAATLQQHTQDAATAAADTAKAGIDRVKEAIPSMSDAASDVQKFVQDQANIDLQKLTDDATNFIRRNPGASLAAAAGVGLLLGILATKRS